MLTWACYMLTTSTQLANEAAIQHEQQFEDNLPSSDLGNSLLSASGESPEQGYMDASVASTMELLSFDGWPPIAADDDRVLNRKGSRWPIYKVRTIQSCFHLTTFYHLFARKRKRRWSAAWQGHHG
jgi:hypothetical protein